MNSSIMKWHYSLSCCSLELSGKPLWFRRSSWGTPSFAAVSYTCRVTLLRATRFASWKEFCFCLLCFCSRWWESWYGRGNSKRFVEVKSSFLLNWSLSININRKLRSMRKERVSLHRTSSKCGWKFHALCEFEVLISCDCWMLKLDFQLLT